MRRIVIALAWSFLVMASFQLLFAQDQVPNCTDLQQYERRWPNGASVYVVRGQGWTDAQYNAAVASVENWNQTNIQNGVLVSFNYNYQGVPPANAPTLTLTWGSIPNNPGTWGAVMSGTMTSSGYIQNATITFDASARATGSNGQLTQAVSSPAGVQKVTAHEIGHTMGFGDVEFDGSVTNTGSPCTGGEIAGSTIMNRACGADDWGGNMPTAPTSCDGTRLQQRFGLGAPPQPVPTPEGNSCPLNCPDPYAYPPQVCYGGVDYCLYDSGCEDDWQPMGRCCCTPMTPVIFDTLGDGINLTGPYDGVEFDLNADEVKDKLSWTASGSDDAWLILDRNQNGSVDDGSELFSNVAEQSKPPKGVMKNGFRALAVYDQPENGGNDDGTISARDTIFESLQLWQDLNHNGASETDELRSLDSAGVLSIDLDYRQSSRTDQNGNQFRFRTKITMPAKKSSPWAWDVLLSSQN